MSRPSPRRSARGARPARSSREFLPAMRPLEQGLLMSSELEGDSLATALPVSLTVGTLYSHRATIGDGAYPGWK